MLARAPGAAPTALLEKVLWSGHESLGCGGWAGPLPRSTALARAARRSGTPADETLAPSRLWLSCARCSPPRIRWRRARRPSAVSLRRQAWPLDAASLESARGLAHPAAPLDGSWPVARPVPASLALGSAWPSCSAVA
jgi:hypothetical protein